MSSGRIEVCLVGAGPRGLSVLERLCAQERKSPRYGQVTIHVVDPGPPGSGRVWRPSQSRHLLMNTVASQVTVFTDSSVTIEGPLEEGPSLYQWARGLALRNARSGAHDAAAGQGGPDEQTLAEAKALGPDAYPTRALYGQYLTWAFRHVTETAPGHVAVRVHRTRAVRVENGTPDLGISGPQTVVLEDGTELTGLSAVVLAQGHVPTTPGAAEQKLHDFASRNDLTYIAPANPADVDLSRIAPGQSVLVRGLGLNFFDYMTLLTQGRGGVLKRVNDHLVYRPSGREPRLYAGSRRGVPYQARGENEKGAHGRYLPRLLTAEYIAGLKACAAGRPRIHFGADLWPLISKEVQCVYYETMIAHHHGRSRTAGFADRYLRAEGAAAEESVLQQAGIASHERWSWEWISRPYSASDLRDAASFRQWLRSYLDQDVALAREGNVSSPVKAALDVLRDLRNEVRLAVDHGGLDGASYRDELDRWYTPLNAYLSIGPPVSRIEEMAALMDAGVLTAIGPDLRVSAEEHDAGGPCFVGTSSVPDSRVRATTLIEGRLPQIDLRRTADPLMRHMRATGQCRPYQIPTADGGSYETGGLAVTPRPYRVLDAHGVPHPRRFAFGVPTESVHWVTAAGIRPGVGSVTLEDSDAIAAAVLELHRPVPNGAPRSVSAGAEHDSAGNGEREEASA